MRISYFADIDILYVDLGDPLPEDQPVETYELDVWRNVDVGPDGIPSGVEFINASTGIDLEGVPHREEIATAIERLGTLRVLPTTHAQQSPTAAS